MATAVAIAATVLVTWQRLHIRYGQDLSGLDLDLACRDSQALFGKMGLRLYKRYNASAYYVVRRAVQLAFMHMS